MPYNEAMHYYGDVTRRLFILGCVIMIVAYPFFTEYIPVSRTVAFAAILVVAIFAGLTNPRQRWVAAADVLIAIAAFVTFEYYAVEFYRADGGFWGLFFWINEALALVFFIATYFAVKTWRGLTIHAGIAHSDRKN